MALAMGADFVMMGRYFAMTEESPTSKISINGQMYKPYWGEGTLCAQNWQRYSEGMSSRKMVFEEGVDAFVPLVGTVAEVLETTLHKLKSTMMNLGADNLSSFKEHPTSLNSPEIEMPMNLTGATDRILRYTLCANF